MSDRLKDKIRRVIHRVRTQEGLDLGCGRVTFSPCFGDVYDVIIRVDSDEMGFRVLEEWNAD